MNREILTAIEMSARCLEQAAADFLMMYRSADRTTDDAAAVEASSLADSYGMAAREVRMQIPAFRAMSERNKSYIKEWQTRLLAGEEVGVPGLELWDFDAAIAAAEGAE